MTTTRIVRRAALLLALAAIGGGCAAPRPRGDAPVTFASDRGARVAVEHPSREAGSLTFLAGAWPEETLAQLRAAAPNVRVIGGLTRESALERAAEADGVDARLVTPAFLERATKLAWIQSPSAGVDRFVGLEGVKGNQRLVVTNFRAVHGPAIADHAFAMLLQLTRDLRFYAKKQDERAWAGEGSGGSPLALEGRTMLVVGLGGIGSEIAQRAHGFGMRVLATRRTAGDKPEWIERVGGPGDLLALLPEADVVAVCTPLTPETERMFDARAFGAMKQGAILVNIARGRIVDTDALLAALDSGRLGGACLDVTDPEPLPADHPLWSRPRVVITPHVAADAALTEQRGLALLRENLRRFGAGEPLLNVVDVAAGY